MRKKKNLYSFLEVKNKEELYEKIKKKDKSVQGLVEFIESLQKIENKKEFQITNSTDLNIYISNHREILKNDYSILFTSARNSVLSHSNFSKDTSLQEVLEGYFPGSAGVILIANFNDSKNKNYYKETEFRIFKGLEEDLDLIGFHVVEKVISFGNDEIYYVKSFNEKKLEKPSEKLFSKKIKKDKNSFKNLENFQDFLTFYSSEELKGKSVLEKTEDIKKLLKAGHEDLKQEYFGIISYDKNYNIRDVQALFKGGVDGAHVDTRTMLPIFLDKKNRGFIFFHNHPSGSVSPSNKDISLTKQLEKTISKIGKEFLDHFIVGKEDVFSFAEFKLIVNKYDYLKNNFQGEKRKIKIKRKQKEQEESNER